MPQLADLLLSWYKQHGRHHLPWQQNSTPYGIWVAEIMLQQTQVQTVIPYYQRFMQAFPDIADLAQADLDAVLHHWSGLGYYARARHLHRAAQIIMQDYQGKFPQQLEQVMALPGIGRSTAAAILSFAFGQPHAILDGNVKRVLCRLFAVSGWPGEAKTLKKLWSLAEALTPKQEVSAYNQAIMDLGALICTRHRPQCGACPWFAHCQARAQDQVLDYPQSKPKSTKKMKKIYLLWLQNESGQVLLQKRPPSGIWGGLWCLPEFEHREQMNAWLQAQEVTILSEKALPLKKHALTHFELHLQPYQILCKKIGFIVQEGDSIWYSRGQKIGLPQPVAELLREYHA